MELRKFRLNEIKNILIQAQERINTLASKFKIGEHLKQDDTKDFSDMQELIEKDLVDPDSKKITAKSDFRFYIHSNVDTTNADYFSDQIDQILCYQELAYVILEFNETSDKSVQSELEEYFKRTEDNINNFLNGGKISDEILKKIQSVTDQSITEIKNNRRHDQYIEMQTLLIYFFPKHFKNMLITILFRDVEYKSGMTNVEDQKKKAL